MTNFSPFIARKPFHLMTKPIGSLCNLDCKYCFYLEKETLFGGASAHDFRMNENLLDNFIRQYIEAQPIDTVSFAWQGGEPTLLGVDFFEKVVSFQNKYANGKHIENAFQTNCTLLNERWCQFFKEHRFLIGASIDGPEAIHDAYRVDKHAKPTFARVIRGIEYLIKHEVEFNTLTCVNRVSSQKPEIVYRFLKGIGSTFLQFIPIVERSADASSKSLGLALATPPQLDKLAPADDNPRVSHWSVRPTDYGNFLVEIFNRWVKQDVGKTYVQIFDVALAKWLGIKNRGTCVFEETCGGALAIEHNGDVYACDHFVYPQYHLGNILNQHLGALVESPAQIQFGMDKKNKLPRYCQTCSVRFACNGECPKHRFESTPDGDPGLNYLCSAYKHFFNHIDPYMRVMADLYNRKQAPALIMQMLKDGTFTMPQQ